MTDNESGANRLDQLVDQFDALWQQGRGPKWTAWLQQVGRPEEQAKLARQLIPIELEYRRQRGETIEPVQDYPEASAEQIALVRELLTPAPHEDATLAPNRAAAKVNSTKELASQTIGPYKLLQKLGEGGMGEVWMAEQKEPVKRRVALKLIKGNATGSREVLARFDAERQALAVMNHPNIARILDAGTTDEGYPFFVMELVQGQPLIQYCDTNKLAIEERLKLFCAVCSGVQHAHQKGIIHRDLKPTNILVGQFDNEAVPKIIDFGLAKALESTQKLTDQSLFTGIGQILGTLKYMSPEQASLDMVDIDTRTDVYSLGVILYELLTGATPLDDETIRGQAALRLLEFIREQEPPRPSTKLSNSKADALSALTSQRKIDGGRLSRLLRGDLDWVVMKALEKNRNRRYESATGLAEDVKRFLVGEPVVARPPAIGYVVRKFILKHRAGVLTAVLLTLALIGGVIGTSVGLYRALKAERLAEQRRSEIESALARESEALKKESAERRRAEEAQKLAVSAQAETSAALEKERAALERESSARQQAELNLQFAKKGNELLGSIFTDLNPNASYDNVAALRNALAENLEQAASALEGTVVGSPLEVAKLQFILGESFRGLGENQKSIAVTKKAFETFQAELGENHRETLMSLRSLGANYLGDGQYENALQALEKAYLATAKQFGPNSREVQPFLNDLAVCYEMVGRVDKAIPLYERCFAAERETLGPNNERTLVTMNNLAYALGLVGQYSKALELQTDCLDRMRESLGAEHPYTLASMNNLAILFDGMNQHENSLRLYEQIYEISKSRMGPDHPQTITSLSHLAASYRENGNFDKAATLQEDAFARLRSKLGSEHPETLAAMNELALVYLSSGELEKALPLCEETHRLRVKVLGERHRDTLTSLGNLAGVFWEKGELERSLPIYQELLKITSEQFGRDAPNTQIVVGQVGASLTDASQFEEAIPFLEEVLKSSKKYPELNKYRHYLFRAFVGAKRFEPFDQLARETAANMRSFIRSQPSEVARGLMTIGIYYLKFQKFAQAEALFRESLEIQEKQNAENWQICETRSALGEALQGLGKLSEAEPLLLAGYEGLLKWEQELASNEPQLIPDAIDRIIQFYRLSDQQTELSKYLELREKYPPRKKEGSPDSRD